jgi:hypothetical protein
MVQDGAQPRTHPVTLLQPILPAQRTLDAILHQIIRLRGPARQPSGITAQRRKMRDQIVCENTGPPYGASQKKQESSFSEEKEAKRLLFLALRHGGCCAIDRE